MTDQSQAPAPTPQRLDDLQPKMKLTGTVKKIELFGAFVDVGVGRDGLVHISAMSQKPVNKVEDIVKEGDTVTVWVRRVDTQAGRIELSMVEPSGLDWSDIRNGQIYTGKVVKIEKFGAFIDIGADRPGLIHISELANYRV
ncbi:MAG: S1 RNA-binding domain-containing protein, partial [Anaerolineales bacterium]